MEKCFPPLSSPVLRVLRYFFSLSRENLFVNTIDPRLTLCTLPSLFASSRLRINCLLKSYDACGRGKTIIPTKAELLAYSELSMLMYQLRSIRRTSVHMTERK
ncbi:hypothetical protein P5V15_014448 [Pogonomyrmex californicus]